MSATTYEPTPAVQVKAILLGYLQCRAAHLWPGGDGLTLDELLRSYPQAARAGRVPGLPELRRRFPDLAAALAAWFAGHTASPDAARGGRPRLRDRRSPVGQPLGVQCLPGRPSKGSGFSAEAR